MKRFLAIPLLLLLFAGGCSSLQNTYDALTGAKVNPTAVIVAGNAFDALQATATNYLRLPRCTPVNRPVCRDPQATAQIIPAVRAGRAARDGLEDFIEKHPDELGPGGLYDALVGANTTLKAIFAQYNVGAPQ